MNTNELGILRLAVAVGVNVYASRYVARIIGIKPDIGGARGQSAWSGAGVAEPSRPGGRHPHRSRFPRSKCARAIKRARND